MSLANTKTAAQFVSDLAILLLQLATFETSRIRLSHHRNTKLNRQYIFKATYDLVGTESLNIPNVKASAVNL